MVIEVRRGLRRGRHDLSSGSSAGTRRDVSSVAGRSCRADPGNRALVEVGDSAAPVSDTGGKRYDSGPGAACSGLPVSAPRPNGFGLRELGEECLLDDSLLATAVGRSILIAGQFTEPVVIESYEDWGEVVSLRVRTQRGTPGDAFVIG